jgi:predicted PurR-regulated permease PerM
MNAADDARQPFNRSPRWGTTTKLVVGLTLVAVVGALLITFRTIIGPLLLAFILTYLLHPLAASLNRLTHFSWRASANITFLAFIIILAGVLTATGVAVVQQLESLVAVIRRFVTSDLPRLVQDLSGQTLVFGPFQLDLRQYNLAELGQQILNSVQGLLGQAGSLVSTVASGAVGVLGWAFFILLISYFLLADAGQVPDAIHFINIPGYDDDIRRLGHGLAQVWNAFLRGQLTIVILVMLASSTMLTVLGLRYALGIALLTGLARFVPYIGPLVTNLVLFVVAFFQNSNYLGLPALYYAILIVGLALVLDNIFDNLISPRLLGQSLGVHPAAVLVAAIVAANLIGLVGVVVAAPVLATINLAGQYITRKMFDLDPFPETAPPEGLPLAPAPWTPLVERIKQRLQARQERIAHEKQSSTEK